MKHLANFALKQEKTPIDNHSQKRAAQVMRCLPFNSIFYKDVKTTGLNAQTVFGRKNQYSSNYGRWFKSSYSVEASFRWLITLGVLRREVDGQGLTSKIRLTPLGRQLLDKDPRLADKQTALLERFGHWVFRNLNLR